MSKRSVAIICVLCCFFAMLCVFCACDNTHANEEEVADIVQPSIANDNTNQNSEEKIDTKNDGYANEDVSQDNDDKQEPADTEELPYGPMVNYLHDEDSLEKFESFLQKIGKNNSYCLLVFDVDDGLPCIDTDCCVLERVKYSFETVINCIDLDEATYVFTMPCDVDGALSVGYLLPPDLAGHEGKEQNGAFSVEYRCEVSNVRFSVADVRLERTSDANFGYCYNILVGEQQMGKITVWCAEEMLTTICSNLMARATVLCNFE